MADNTITVAGHAARDVAPDVAAWRLTVAAVHREPRVAYEQCAERATAIVERLGGTADVETQRVSVEPTYESAHRVGHEASTVVIARVPVERAGELADLAMAAGAERVRGPMLELTDRGAVELDALEDALADARRRAERLASAAGRSLGPILSIDTVERRGWDGTAVRERAAMPVEVGDISVSVSVIVVFALAG
jgi:uncharacterized protein YggE